MVIFHSYVSLPEGKFGEYSCSIADGQTHPQSSTHPLVQIRINSPTSAHPARSKRMRGSWNCRDCCSDITTCLDPAGIITRPMWFEAAAIGMYGILYIHTYIYIYVHIVIWYIYIWNVWNEMRIHANSIVAVHKSLTRSTFHFWRVLRYGPEEFQVFYLSHEMIWAFPFVDLAFSFKLYTTLHNQLQRQLA